MYLPGTGNVKQLRFKYTWAETHASLSVVNIARGLHVDATFYNKRRDYSKLHASELFPM